jgi:RNA polymerase sigma-70 factor (ECF subfamily)
MRLLADREEARDLLQETFLRAARQPSFPSADPAAEAWLVRTLVNLSRDLHRRRATRTRALPRLQAEASTAPSPERAVEARFEVRTALAALPPRKRAILVLHELEGLAIGDIARLLGLRNATVRWHLASSRKRLSELAGAPVPSPQEGRVMR